MSELLRAAKAIIEHSRNGGADYEVFERCLDDLITAVKSEEDKIQPGEWAVYGQGRYGERVKVIADAPGRLIRLSFWEADDYLDHYADLSSLRRPTEEELADWPTDKSDYSVLKFGEDCQEAETWSPGDRAVIVDAREYTGAQCTCLKSPRVLVKIHGALGDGDWVGVEQLRRPTVSELAAWPGDDNE